MDPLIHMVHGWVKYFLKSEVQSGQRCFVFLFFLKKIMEMVHIVTFNNMVFYSSCIGNVLITFIIVRETDRCCNGLNKHLLQISPVKLFHDCVTLEVVSV